jgi:beta-fructofuranosidase
MLQFEDKWVWDSWTIDKGAEHHLFYLQAPKQGHHDDRHTRATVGHAVSSDFVDWQVLPDALHPAPAPAWDDLAIWTGSVVRSDTGVWHLFYSALSQNENGTVQRIGRADSADLVTWTRFGDRPLVEADPRWYETAGSQLWHEEAWRDPFVFRDPKGDGWHMLITARAREGSRLDRGVLGHARSTDLANWVVQPPLTDPAGFGHLEVAHTAWVDGRWVLLFCCLAADLDEARRRRTPSTGMWSAPAASGLGPFDLQRAAPFDDPSIYAAHLVRLPGERPGLLGFTYMDGDMFSGTIGAPVPAKLDPDGTVSMDTSDQHLATRIRRIEG